MLGHEQKSGLRARIQSELRRNTYDSSTGAISISPLRAEAIRAVQSHYTALFGDDPALGHLRESYAMPRSVIPDADRREVFTGFIFWSSWASATERPGKEITYTHNWPPEDLVGNRPTGVMIVVSVVSFVLLLGGIGGLAWFYAASRDTWRSQAEAAPKDPLAGVNPTPSMRASHKYFWIVGALAVGQVVAGIGQPTTAWRVRNSTEYPFRSLSPTPSLEPGMYSWACSGSPLPGWQRGCASRRWWQGMSPGFRDWA